jgi:RNA polymerase sigma-70 factor (ECF subfamily)
MLMRLTSLSVGDARSLRLVDRPGDRAGGQPNPDAASDVSQGMSALASEAAAPASALGDDGNEFDRLFAAHYQRLVRALTLVAGDTEAAADAVQEAFVKAHLRWRKISRYDDPIGWVRRVAINQIRDGHRRRARKDRAVARLSAREQVAEYPVEPDEFGRLLAELPKQQRAATALFYVDGLSVAEIAVALDVSEGTVKSHLHDARRRLRPILEGERP